MKEFTEKAGWKTVTEQLAPLGTADFSSYLLNIANSGADVFVNVAFGADATASTKQAEQFGILSKMKYVVPNISQFQAKELGAESWAARTAPRPGGGPRRTNIRWPSSSSRTSRRRTTTSRIGERAKSTFSSWSGPTRSSAPARSIRSKSSRRWRAEHKVNSIYGEVYYRAGDHQMVRPVPVMVGKKPNEMKGPDDFFQVLDLVPGERCCRRSIRPAARCPTSTPDRIAANTFLKGRPRSMKRGRPILPRGLASLSDAPAAAEGDIVF